MVYNRSTKKIEPEKVFDKRKMDFLYNNKYGKRLTKLFLRKHLASIIYSYFQNTKKSRKKIPSFIEEYNINTDILQKNISEFTSFNDFFIREIKDEHIKIDTDKNAFISPADSRVLVAPITDTSVYTIKSIDYTISDLIDDPTLAKEYQNGLCLIFRLAVYDYHRFCYVDNGELLSKKTINGFLDSVNINYTKINSHITNYRKVSRLSTENFGEILEIDVGAMLVGKIRDTHSLKTFKKGEEKGYFEYGGSTVAILVKANQLKVDSDILLQSKNGIETLVKQGEKIGVKL